MSGKLSYAALKYALKHIPFWEVVGYTMATKGYVDYPEIDDNHFTIHHMSNDEVSPELSGKALGHLGR